VVLPVNWLVTVKTSPSEDTECVNLESVFPSCVSVIVRVISLFHEGVMRDLPAEVICHANAARIANTSDDNHFCNTG
jgi:hypothetical protein